MRLNARRLFEAKRRLRLMFRALQIIRHAAGGWTIVWCVLIVVQGLVPAGIVYGTKWLVDSVAAAMGAGSSWDIMRTVLAPGIFMALLLLLQRTLGSVIEWVQAAQSEHVLDDIKERIHSKAAAVGYQFYESSDFYDRLEQANSQAASHTVGLLRNLGTLLESTVTFVSIAAILVQYGVLLPLLLLASTLPAVYIIIRFNRLHHDWWKQRTSILRWSYYFDGMLTRRDSAAEVRALGLSEYLRSEYRSVRRRLRTERLSLLKRQVFATASVGVFALVVTGGVMAWMLWRAFGGLATLGDLALFYQAFNQGQKLMRSLLGSVGEIYTNTLFLDHLFVFLEQPDEMQSKTQTGSAPGLLSRGIRFENVTFHYPGSSVPALSNFDLEIRAGTIAAIIGENGAGKSTLAKLLLRLYDPDEGAVTIDGVDVREYSVDVLRRQISAMFQFPIRYQASAADNIAFGDLNLMSDSAAIEAAASAAGARSLIEDLPDRFDTVLGRLFKNGVELSGGEWQRVALARAFLRKAPVIVLDEPTSSMDSWSENEWFQRFRRLVGDRTGIIITHRLSIACQADVIHVLKKGRLVESGSHEELIRADGMYALSWERQTRGGSDWNGVEDSIPLHSRA